MSTFFIEYGERTIERRQKYKEQCDKDIQEIIEKDKIQKSLAEKVEKGCLRCGCGLGGVAAGVGIIGPIAVNELNKAALVAAAQKGIDAGIVKAIAELYNKFLLTTLNDRPLTTVITARNFKDINVLGHLVQAEYNRMLDAATINDNSIFSMYHGLKGTEPIQAIAANARTAATKAAAEAARVEGVEITAANTASYDLYIAIAYSVTAILVIVLIMIIIYLILRYRRKKKKKKKIEYTKLLKE
ncbi:rifin [Plasmodium falciparum RAJ116]|uniref:Rifin n=1 Tax=Plasmodium falciparum RAJ116 TaxID=580058 RepID=A0A0L0CTG9_PLAFA|nr:rifin [Plasmodium falciparum RAJ116]